MHYLRPDILVFIIPITAIIGGLILAGWCIWLGHQKEMIQEELKHEMLARGMSADEIVRVLNAGDPQKAVKSQTADRNRT